MNKNFIYISLISLLTFWGSELKSCSVDENISRKEITLEEFKTSYDAIDKSFNILTYDIKTSYDAGLTTIKDWNKGDRKPLSSYYYGESITDPISDETKVYELKLVNGLYCYYENDLVTKTYTDVNEVKDIVDNKFNTLINSIFFINDFNDFNENDYKYYLNEDNTLSFIYNDETTTYDTNGLLVSIINDKKTIKNNNYKYEVKDYNKSITYEISRS